MSTERVTRAMHAFGCHKTGDECDEHGALWGPEGCTTAATLVEVSEHRKFQYANYGNNRALQDGTGPEVEWLAPVVEAARSAWAGSDGHGGIAAYDIEGLFREEWDYDRDPKAPYTWLMMAREEFAEVAGQADPEYLHGELIQLSAVCAAWAEKIKERGL